MPKDYHSDNKSFIIYKDWEEYVDALGSDEEAGKLFKALFAFAKRAEEAEFVGALKMAFIVMRNSIERDGEKWENTCLVRSEAGKKGGRPSKSNDFSENQAKSKKAKGFFEKQTKAKKADKDTETETDIEKDKNTPPTPSKGAGEGFDEFWKVYPKKVAKAQALKAWSKLKPDADLQQVILNALERQKQSAQWQKDNGQFIPYPATWLNNYRWEDVQEQVVQPAPPKYEYDPDNPYANWD